MNWGGSPLLLAFFRLGCHHSGLVISRSFPLFKGDGIGGTGRQAITQPVAVILTGQLGLPVYHFNSAFMAGIGTSAAAVALFFIDFNNFSFHTHNSSCIHHLCGLFPAAIDFVPTVYYTVLKKYVVITTKMRFL